MEEPKKIFLSELYMKPVLIYITDGYPYGHGEIFPGDELPFLAAQNWDICLMPTSRNNSSIKVVLPDNVTLYEDLIVAKNQKFISLFSLEALRLLFEEYRSYKERNLFFSLKRALRAISTCLTAKKRLSQFIKSNSLEGRPLIVYNYWCNSVALGCSLLKKMLPNVCFISRIHGYDLFPERYKNGYLPFRFLRICAFNKIIAVSSAGIDQLLKDGHDRARLELYHLGVPQPKGLALISHENMLYIISCSNLASVKRLPLLISSIKTYASNRPDLLVNWQHYGGGSSFEQFKELACSELENIANLRFKLHGHLSVERVRQSLAVNCGDVFINTSVSEGGVPVSLQEAGCCGIPLLATDAGGSREIVNDETGILLPLHFSQQDFNDALDKLLQWKVPEKRSQIAEHCLNRFSQEKNYSKFVEEVLQPLFKGVKNL